MTWDGSGVFVRLHNWQQDRDASIDILAERMDNELDGMVAGINDIVEGTRDFKGVTRHVAGTAALPGIAFVGDTDTGIYQIGANNIGIAVGGALIVDINGTRMNILGNLVWHANNDGAGSGLDADLLDGQHASAFAASSHTHSISDVTSLQTTLDGKAASSHTHSISDVTGLEARLGAWQEIETITSDGTDNSLQSTADLSSYDLIRVTVTGLPDAVDNLRFRAGTAGPTWLTGHPYGALFNWSYFNYNTETAGSNVTASNKIASGGDAFIEMNPTGQSVDDGAGAGTIPNGFHQFILTDFGKASTQWKNFILTESHFAVDGAQATVALLSAHGLIESAAALTVFELYWATGTTDWTSDSKMVIEGLTF